MILNPARQNGYINIYESMSIHVTIYNDMKCEICTFEDVLPIWDKDLWPNRVSKIESRSSLFWHSSLWEGFGNVSITKKQKEIWKYEPTFFCIRDNDKIIGVNSGFRTEDKVYRSRGLYVDNLYRCQGLSQKLLEATIQQGKREGCSWIWSLPRKTALPAYNKLGFYKVGNWIDEGVEFGPNCLAIHKLL